MRIAVLSTKETASQRQLQEAGNAASRLGVELAVVEVRDDDYDRAKIRTAHHCRIEIITCPRPPAAATPPTPPLHGCLTGSR